MIFQFLDMNKARAKQEAIHKIYGYRPTIFAETHPKTKRTQYVIIRPRGLKKIRW